MLAISGAPPANCDFVVEMLRCETIDDAAIKPLFLCKTLVPLRHNDLKTEVDNFDKDMAFN